MSRRGVIALHLLAFAGAAPPQLYPATSAHIRVVGRTARATSTSTTLFFDWSSVYITARLTGPASIVLHEARNASKAPQHPPGAAGNSYLITLAGVAGSVRLNTSANATDYDLGLAPGQTATVRIEKVTVSSPPAVACDAQRFLDGLLVITGGPRGFGRRRGIRRPESSCTAPAAAGRPEPPGGVHR